MDVMRIIDHQTVYRDEEAYVSFPNLAVLGDGAVLCAFRHAAERQKTHGSVTHIDPTAKNVFIRSDDGGRTFRPELHAIVDDQMSAQDPCLTVLSDGRILATYFRWQLVPIGKGEALWGKERFEKYGHSLHGTYDCYLYGASCAISDDQGGTWRHRHLRHIDGVPDSIAVRGNCLELENGDLLMPFYGTFSLGELSRSGLFISHDRGENWQYLSTMAFDRACEKNYLEPNIYRTESGRIIGLFRTQSDFSKPKAGFGDTYLNLHIAVSDDGGKTFGEVREIQNVWGSNPFHALRLKSGKVLLTYGYRRPPFGIRARLCNSELSDIGEAPEMILRSDASGSDLGYPHAAQLENGDILVAYYLALADSIRTIDITRLRE